MKVIVTNWKEGFPVELVGKILEIDENNKVIGEGEFKGLLLEPKEFRKIYPQEPDELLQKVLDGEELDEDELRELFYEYDSLTIESEVGEKRRWSRMESKTMNIFGRYFDVQGDIALTESGESYFDIQPVEYEVTPEVKTVKVFSYKYKKKGEDK